MASGSSAASGDSGRSLSSDNSGTSFGADHLGLVERAGRLHELQLLLERRVAATVRGEAVGLRALRPR